ncbi:MAG TPA: FecR domain-containing protein [Vicinamibacteria bacterium]|nr:FecR domain-containing protein [Vicinamibacteria bacterium]
MAAPDRRRVKSQDDTIDWFTVSYRSIFIALLFIVLVGGAVGYYFWPREAPGAAPVEAPPATVTTARFTTLEGNVKVKTVGTFEWVNADRAMVLRKSDLVRTGPGSAAEITFFDGTVVHVRPDSLITIEETSEDPSTKRRKVAWHISSGEVQFNAPRPGAGGSEREISTPTLRTTTREAAAGGVAVQESGESNIKLYSGTAKVETKTGETLQLEANTQVKVDAAGKAAPAHSLPPVPALLAPQHQTEITYQDPARATTLLVWKPVPGAAGYHVMLDYNAYFNRPLVDRSGITESSVEVRGLDVGKYYWRVAAVDKDGVEGSFSDFARFTVSRPQGGARGTGDPPPILIESIEVRQNILQVRGRTEPGATLTVNGQRVDVAADGGFNEFIQLPAEKAGRQIVVFRAVGINGGVAQTQRSVMVGE